MKKRENRCPQCGLPFVLARVPILGKEPFTEVLPICLQHGNDAWREAQAEKRRQEQNAAEKEVLK